MKALKIFKKRKIAKSECFSEKYEHSKFYIIFEEDIVEDNETSLSRSNLQTLYHLEDSFFCIICDKLLYRNCQLECGHRVCLLCLQNYLAKGETTCPASTCPKHQLHETLRDTTFDKELALKRCKCVNQLCKSSVSLLDFYDHRRLCDFTIIKCRNCFANIQISKQSKHIVDECPMKSANFNSSGNNNYARSISQEPPNGVFYSEDEFDSDPDNDSSLRRTTTYSYYVWEISHFSHMTQQTANQKPAFILSPPFYTDDIGYKIQLKAYPHGNGTGEGTHLSLFMSIIPGKYDDDLEWPFMKTFTIELVNPNQRPDIMVTFTPTRESKCFRKPKKKANLSSGSPRFINVESLDEFYTNNDILRIRFIVYD